MKTKPMFYRFERARVSIAATPKTGSTSVLTFLMALERQLGLHDDLGTLGATGAELGSPVGDSPDESAPILMNRLKRFAVSLETPLAKDEFRLATVRDPAERIASCWLDKLVDGPAVWQAKYFSENWFPTDFRTPNGLEASFSAFLEALRSDQVLLHSDMHWAPQAWLLRSWDAEAWITTEDLRDLPRAIVARLGPLVEAPPMPHKHRTTTWLKQFILTPNTQSLIGEVYALDYAFLERHCPQASISRHTPRAGFNASDALKLPALDREIHLQRTRTLARAVSTILQSSVWSRRFAADEQGS